MIRVPLALQCLSSQTLAAQNRCRLANIQNSHASWYLLYSPRLQLADFPVFMSRDGEQLADHPSAKALAKPVAPQF